MAEEKAAQGDNTWGMLRLNEKNFSDINITSNKHHLKLLDSLQAAVH